MHKLAAALALASALALSTAGCAPPATARRGDSATPAQVEAEWTARLQGALHGPALRDELLQAVEDGDAERMAKALRAGGDADARTEVGHTLLIRAARRGDLAQVELLLAHGADLEALDECDSNRGDTALLVALYGGHEKVARRLLAAGARTDVKNRWDWGPLHMATQSDCLPCLQLAADELRLSIHEAALASRGETPVMIAAARGRLAAMQWLVARGADLQAQDAHGHDALAWAEFFKQDKAAEWIRERVGR